MLETIKQYLVGLGFSVDKASYDKTKKAMSSLESGAVSFASKAVKAFGKASAAIIAFGVAATTATAKFLGGLGNEEIKMEMLSRQLWTTQQQARAFSATLKAMGASLQDLYLSPTLMAQYEKLHGVALQMQTPGDYNNQVKQVQSVQLQIKQMRLEAYYSLQWIGYYFIKYMEGPISKVHNVLASINAVIVKNMPTWTKRVAQVMASFMQAGIYIVQALTSVYHWLQKMLQYVPGWAKGIAAALAVFSISNPFMLLMEAIAGAILLLDDFDTYLKDPSKSAFPQLWAWVEKVSKAIKGFTGLKSIIIGLVGTFAGLAILKSVISWLKAARIALIALGADNPFGIVIMAIAALVAGLILFDHKSKRAHKAVGELGNAFKDVWNAIKNVLSGIGNLFNALTNNKNRSGMQGFFTLISDLAIGAIKVVAGAIEEIAGLVNVVGDTLHGNWRGAGQVIKSMWTGQNLANAGILPQNWVAGAKGPPIGPPSYPYMFKGNSSTSSKTVHVDASQTNHIHGSSAQGTANAIQHNYNRHLHNLKGVIG